ncbi:MAG: acyl-CoA thioesterase [Bacteroidales bacterium]|nr:acyl-CoA thioesterase [Bacteroidales bacterium]
MLEFSTTLRVRYSEVDPSGFVYNGHYATFYEVGRTASIRSMKLSYKEIEERGVVMPLIYQNSRFYSPAFYDDLLTIKVKIAEMPKARITFYYEIYNEAGKLLNTGENALAFIDKQTHRPLRAPDWFVDILQKEVDKKS